MASLGKKYALNQLVRTRTDIKLRSGDTVLPMLFVASYHEIEQLHILMLLHNYCYLATLLHSLFKI